MNNYSSNNQVKLSFGLRNGELIHISTVPSGLACECYCANCGTKLIARKGEKNAHCFAHYHAEECKYAIETALHLAAKKVLEEANQIALPKLIIQEQVSRQSHTKKGEATVCEQHMAHITNVVPEKRLGSIIPDIIAYIDDSPIIIELAVTHFVDNDKKNKISELGISCIEIDLSDVFRAADFESVRTIVIDAITEKSWHFHTEEANVRAELIASLEAELQNELDEIYRREQKRQRQQQIELENAEIEQQQRQNNWLAYTQKAKQPIETNLRLMYDYIAERDSRYSRFAQKLNNLVIWKRASDNMGISVKTLPDFLNHPVKGEDIFACDRRAWQAGLFSAFIYNKFQKYDKPYPISIIKMTEWCQKHVPINQFALELWLDSRFLESTDFNALRDFNLFSVQIFVDHLEVCGFIERYDLNRYKIVNDTLSKWAEVITLSPKLPHYTS